MQNTGLGSEKRSYRVILLLIVGLAAFSSAMKELNQVHELTLQTGQLIAQWTDALPQGRNEILVKADTCDSKIKRPAVPALPPLPPAQAIPAVPPAEIEIVVPDAVPHAAPAAPAAPPAKPRRVVRAQREVPVTAKAVEAPEVRVFISTEEILDKALKDAFEADFHLKALKAKNRRHIVISPDGREVILKSLNRSINLRTS